MAKTIKDLAKELNCSYEAVRKQTRRYAKELEDHIYTQHKTQYLDDFACDFIRSKRMSSPVVISRIEHDEAMELLKQKYTDLLEKHTELQEQKYQLELENKEMKLLEAKNCDLSAVNEELGQKVAELEKTSQNANMRLETLVNGSWRERRKLRRELKNKNKE